MTLVNADAPSGHIGDNRRNLNPFHDVTAIEIIALLPFKRLAEVRRVVGPMQQISTRNVLPAGKVHFIWAVFYLLQVPQMVPAVEEHRAIDVIPTALWR